MSTIAVRPPEYFPNLSFLALGLRADILVLADTFQYSRQSHQNRAALRNPQGWQWISVPLKTRGPDCPVRDAEIENREPWQRKHWRAMEYNYRSTPYFEFFEPDLEPLMRDEWTYLGALTCASVEFVFEQFGVTVDVRRASALPGAPDSLEAVVRAAAGKGAAPGAAAGKDDVSGASGPPVTLLSPPDAAPHDAGSGYDVQVLSVEEPEYRQNFEGFESGMSAVDLLFNYGPEGLHFVTDNINVESLESASP